MFFPLVLSYLRVCFIFWYFAHSQLKYRTFIVHIFKYKSPLSDNTESSRTIFFVVAAENTMFYQLGDFDTAKKRRINI